MSPVPEKAWRSSPALLPASAPSMQIGWRGHDLILVARNSDKLADVAQRIGVAMGRSVQTIVADLTQASDLVRIEELLLTDPTITILVNNAGMGAIGPLIASGRDKMADLVSLNVAAPTRLAHAPPEAFSGRGAGSIINISSIVALASDMLNSAYGASKAYMLAFSQALQHELAAKGMRVQAVLPGITATAFWDRMGRPAEQLPASMVIR